VLNIEAQAKEIYQKHAKEATEALVKFLRTRHPQPVVVTYFDEADGLDTLFWVLLRLLSNQSEFMEMWYVFMATKASINYFNPIPANSEFCVLSSAYVPQPRTVISLRLKTEIMSLLPPYIALGFDQNAIAGNQTPKHVTVAQLQTLEHLSQYGRPLYMVSVFMNAVAHCVLDGERYLIKKTHRWSSKQRA
jgi:hypothetical protein